MTTEFIGSIAHPIELGHVIVIGGKSIDGATRLEICLKSGKQDDAIIPLQISVLFNEDIITRKSYLGNDQWTDEEQEENLNEFALTNPLIAGDDFQFYIFVGENNFHIAINKIPYCTYSFKTSIGEIRTISVSKDVQVVNQIDHRSIFPYPQPVVQSDSKASFSNDVAKYFQPGYVIVVTGIPYGNSKGKFVLCFNEENTKRELLHFNPRFKPDYFVVRNAMDENLQFGAEDREGDFPFAINEQFKLAIALTQTEFLFAINGSFFGSFKYRTNDIFHKMNGFKIHTMKGLQLEITSVDHLIMGTLDCLDFETYSRPDVDVM